MANPPIYAVALDAVGVLIHSAAPIGETYYRIACRFGNRLEPAEIGTRFRAAFARQEAIDAEAGWRVDEPRERQRWQAIVRETLDERANTDQCLAELWAHFARPDVWTVSAQWNAVVNELARSGIPVVVASNFDSRLHTVLDPHPIRAQLLNILVSSEVGWRKPAVDFFEATAKALATPCESVLFVGDDVRNDYDGARAAGMQALLFDPSGKAKVPCIAAASEVLGMVAAHR